MDDDDDEVLSLIVGEKKSRPKAGSFFVYCKQDESNFALSVPLFLIVKKSSSPHIPPGKA